MSNKLDELSKKIEAAKHIREESPENFKKPKDSVEREMSLASKLSVELFAGILVGTFVGYFFDEVLGTSPIFLIVFIILGAAAGFWNVYKMISRDMDKK